MSQRTLLTPQSPVSRERKRRFVDLPVESNGSNPGKLTKPRFLLMNSTTEGKTLKDVSVFRLARELKAYVGELDNITRLRNGSLLIEGKSDDQITKALSITSIAGLSVNVQEHATLNFCKGVITCKDLVQETEEEILSELAEEGVVAIYRVKNRVDGALVPTPTLILTFKANHLPESISVGFYRVRVRQYIPNPLRCYKCQKFGHTQNNCRTTTPVCRQCERETLEQLPCVFPPVCVNCEGSHASDSRTCPQYTIERGIQKLRAEEKLSFAEARRVYRVRNPVTMNKTFAQVAKQPAAKHVWTHTAACQTDEIPEMPPARKPKLRTIATQVNPGIIATAMHRLQSDSSLQDPNTDLQKQKHQYVTKEMARSSQETSTVDLQPSAESGDSTMEVQTGEDTFIKVRKKERIKKR